MAHYAFLDENNTVTEVIVGIDETELIEGLDPETWYGNFRGQVCKRTSYNGNIRKNYAGIGYIYDPVKDAFYEPEPESITFTREDGKVIQITWTFNDDTCRWEEVVTVIV